MRKLYKAEYICLLTPEYFKTVIEIASLWVKIPYNNKYAEVAFYKKNLLSKTIHGYIVMGFKINWPSSPISQETPLNLELSESINFFMNLPFERIFISKNLFHRLEFMESRGCLIELREYGTVKRQHKDFGKMPVFCLANHTFIKELTDDELAKIKSIDAFVAGDKE